MRSITCHFISDDSPVGSMNSCSVASDKYPITVNCAGNFVTGFPFTTDNPTGREDYYLLYMVRGNMRVWADGKETAASSGSVFIFPPHTHYTYTYDGRDTLDYLWAHFTGSFAKELLTECGMTDLPYYGEASDSGRISNRFRRMFEAFEIKAPLFERKAAVCLEEIILELSASMNRLSEVSPLENSLRYIHSAYSEKISVPQLAAMENLSNSRYIALFNKHLGMSPTAYIIKLRINTACELLISTDMSIKQVGISVGYPDSHFFSKLFKKYMGASPNEYRYSEKGKVFLNGNITLNQTENEMNTVRVTVNEKTILAKADTLLSNIIDIEKPCGGRGTCGKCKVKVNGKDELACQYTVESDIEVETYERSEIISETGMTESGRLTKNLCLALDIGTTTLALALVSLDEKKVVKAVTATNPQRLYGADVITRIDYCQRNSVNELQRVLISEINRMIGELGVSVDTLYVSANVTMLHTLFGVDCTSIGIAPYTPAFLEGKNENAEAVGIKGVKTVISLPSISSFVGADIVAGLHLIGMPEDGKYNLLIDLGTNAEVVLYSGSSGVATAAAAGPCFEGANISCGMSATKGAIYAFSLERGTAEYKTISDQPPIGICGTGLIDIISELVKNGIIDETGYMDEDYTLADGVYLSCEDVRQYQLAKSAVYSAILSLMKTEGVAFEDISKMYISGGFSAKVNIPNAISCGLLPSELADKIVAINNSSLQGAVKYACEGGNIERFTDMIKYVDLSSNQYFSELFMENMMFE